MTRLSKDGYVVVTCPISRRQTSEHGLIAERAYGKRLPSKAQVHHVNGNKTDNRPQNLVICQNNAYHRLLHVRTDAWNACGNANWRRCSYCGVHDNPKTMALHASGDCMPQYHHAACHNEYKRLNRPSRAKPKATP